MGEPGDQRSDRDSCHRHPMVPVARVRGPPSGGRRWPAVASSRPSLGRARGSSSWEPPLVWRAWVAGIGALRQANCRFPLRWPGRGAGPAVLTWLAMVCCLARVDLPSVQGRLHQIWPQLGLAAAVLYMGAAAYAVRASARSRPAASPGSGQSPSQGPRREGSCPARPPEGSRGVMARLPPPLARRLLSMSWRGVGPSAAAPSTRRGVAVHRAPGLQQPVRWRSRFAGHDGWRCSRSPAMSRRDFTYSSRVTTLSSG
jgi:hypothetical protein